MSSTAWSLDELLRTLSDAADRHVGRVACTPAEARRLRDAAGAARAMLATMPRGPEACAVGGCTVTAHRRWPTLDGGTVPVCARHHDLADSYVERKGYDDEEALWHARTGR